MVIGPAVIGAGVGLLTLVLLVPEVFLRQGREFGRLVAILQGGDPSAEGAATAVGRGMSRFFWRLARPFGHLASGLMGSRYRDRLKAQLEAARVRGLGVEEIFGGKVLAALVVGGYFALVGWAAGSPVFDGIAPLMTILAFLVPDQLLSGKVMRRREQIGRELPAMGSALAIGIEAGLSLGSALEEAARRPGNVLAEEFREVLEEVRLGRPPQEAMEEMARRLSVADLTVFVSTLVQGFDKGSPELVRLLREQSQEAWVRRRARAETLAQQASIKLFLPLIALIFPALIIFLFFPAVLTLVGFFANHSYG